MPVRFDAPHRAWGLKAFSIPIEGTAGALLTRTQIKAARHQQPRSSPTLSREPMDHFVRLIRNLDQLTPPHLKETPVLESIDRLITHAAHVQAWFLAQPMPIQIAVGAIALALLWALWIVLRVTIVAFRAAFRGL